MKKFFLLILTVVLIFSMSTMFACAGKKSDKPSSLSEESSIASETTFSENEISSDSESETSSEELSGESSSSADSEIEEQLEGDDPFGFDIYG